MTENNSPWQFKWYRPLELLVRMRVDQTDSGMFSMRFQSNPNLGFNQPHDTTLVVSTSRDAVVKDLQQRSKAVKAELGIFSTGTTLQRTPREPYAAPPVHSPDNVEPRWSPHASHIPMQSPPVRGGGGMVKHQDSGLGHESGSASQPLLSAPWLAGGAEEYRQQPLVFQRLEGIAKAASLILKQKKLSITGTFWGYHITSAPWLTLVSVQLSLVIWENPTTFGHHNVSKLITEPTVTCHLIETVILVLYVVDMYMYVKVWRTSPGFEIREANGFWTKTTMLHVSALSLCWLDILLTFMATYTGVMGRFSRPLRPLFLVTKIPWLKDFSRTTFRSLLTVADSCIVPFTIVVMFAVFACNAVPLEAGYAAGEIGFENIGTALVNMFVVLTTENYPDILHDTLIIASNGSSDDYGDNSKVPLSGMAYAWSAFYVVYLMFGLFALANLMLAIIWDVYKAEYRRKALKARSEEREGLLTAFMTLDYNRTGEFQKEVWHPFIRALLPKVNYHEADLMFDMLDVSLNGSIGPHEFIKLNDMIDMSEKSPLDSDNALRRQEVGELTQAVRRIVSSRCFEWTISISIGLCSLVLITNQRRDSHSHQMVSFALVNIFLGMFLIELCMRIAAFGTRSLFTDWSKAFDSLIIVVNVIGFIIVWATPWLPNFSTTKRIQSILIFRIARLFVPGISRALAFHNLAWFLFNLRDVSISLTHSLTRRGL